jgi:outer membrane protein OmpA-like peptidoglycan-associated protein
MFNRLSTVFLACAIALVPCAHAEQLQGSGESPVNASYNADKRIALAPPTILKVRGETIGLKVHIVVVEGSTLNIAGSKAGIVKETVNIEENLRKLKADVRKTEIVIRLLGNVLFAFDRFDLRPDAVGSLREVLGVVNSYAKSPVRVEGHTDSIGSDAYNQKLSVQRAQAVANWLKANGVARSRLSVKGFGESKPVETNETDQGRQQNRRVEIVIQTS